MKIAFLNDIHFRNALDGDSPVVERKSRLMRRMLPECLADIARAKPDLLICCGDLIDHFSQPGWRDDLEAVHDIFEQCGVPYQAIPGNHDPQPDTFYKVFSPPRARCASALAV